MLAALAGDKSPLHSKPLNERFYRRYTHEPINAL
jgi:hypothetical protein